MTLNKNQIQSLIDELDSSKYLFANINDVIEDINKNGASSKYIIITDIDTQQVCVKLSDFVFIYSQKDFSDKEFYKSQNDCEDRFLTQTIDLTKFSDKKIEENIYNFYSSIDEVKKLYTVDWKQIVAECIFENIAMDNY